MPEALVEVAGSLVRVKPVALLAESPSMVLAASLEEAPWTPPQHIVDALARVLTGDARRALAGMAPREAALAAAAAYGGIVLVSKTRPPAVMARVLPQAGLSLWGSACEPAQLGDRELVEAWARVYWGEPLDAHCMVEPRGLEWSHPGPVRVAPVGYRSEPVNR